MEKRKTTKKMRIKRMGKGREMGTSPEVNQEEKSPSRKGNTMKEPKSDGVPGATLYGLVSGTHRL